MGFDKVHQCIHESSIDTIEISLRRAIEYYISIGQIENAEQVEETIKDLEEIPNVCRSDK